MAGLRRIVVTGRVQGVGYRAFVADVARRCGLEGWVRNRRDGSVEAVLAGSDSAIAEAVAQCRRGPPQAHVAEIGQLPAHADDLALRRTGERFSLLPTL